MIINVLTLICLMVFSSTIQGQYYENGKYGTNKSETVYSAKYTTQPTKGLFNQKKGCRSSRTALFLYKDI